MLGGIELWRERRRDEHLALLADDEFARVGWPARLFGGLFADPGARRHVLIGPDMDDLVERPDFGVPEGRERRQFRAVRQCLGKALLEFRRRAGIEGIGAHLDDHLGVLPGFGTATLARPAGGDKGDRKSTRLNSSHVSISYAVFCLKKKTPTL